MSYPRANLMASPRRARRVLALMALVAFMFPAAPAEAGTTGLTATTTTNRLSVGKCSFAVKSVDPGAETVRARFGQSVRPTSLSTASYTAHVSVDCFLYAMHADGYFYYMDVRWSRHADGARILFTSVAGTVPLHDGYGICAKVSSTTDDGFIFHSMDCSMGE